MWCFCAAGCATTSKDVVAPRETAADVHQAVGKIADSLEGKVIVHYCPVCGAHYSSRVKICPKDGTPLKVLDE